MVKLVERLIGNRLRGTEDLSSRRMNSLLLYPVQTKGLNRLEVLGKSVDNFYFRVLVDFSRFTL